MLYLIPAWYQDDSWNEKNQVWYRRRMHTEFDDSVKQSQLFYRTGAVPFCILLLSYAPNLRHFLHRQSMYHVPYWSCFDAIQEVQKTKAVVFSFHNLAWPEHIEFVYTPFAVVAMLDGQKYALVEFGEDGNPIEVTMYAENIICRKNIYDDRGFVSSTILYEKGNMLYQDYLTEQGIWKIRQYFSDGHVEVNPATSAYLMHTDRVYQEIPFKKSRYGSMTEVIEEVVQAFLQCADEKALFCEALHGRHVALLDRLLDHKRLILSVYGDRFSADELVKNSELLRNAGYLITDSEESTGKLSGVMGQKPDCITDISPYDTRVEMGISSQLKVQKIMVPVDGLPGKVLADTVVRIARYFEKNHHARMHIFTRRAENEKMEAIIRIVRKALAEGGFPEGLLDTGDEKKFFAENDVDQEEICDKKIFVEQCVSELEVSKCMREQRLILDMRDTEDLYLRISAISMGIPQILVQRSQFVEFDKSGKYLNDPDETEELLDFYLHGVGNWNKARISTYELGREYSTDKLLEKWRKVIEAVG